MQLNMHLNPIFVLISLKNFGGYQTNIKICALFYKRKYHAVFEYTKLIESKKFEIKLQHILFVSFALFRRIHHTFMFVCLVVVVFVVVIVVSFNHFYWMMVQRTKYSRNVNILQWNCAVCVFLLVLWKSRSLIVYERKRCLSHYLVHILFGCV